VKFKLGENLPADLAVYLREAGRDVSDVVEAGLSGGDDALVLDAATKEHRVLLTFDLDFADIRQYPPDASGGIVVFRLHDQRWQSLRKPIKRLLAAGALDDLLGGLAIVDELRARYKRSAKKNSPKGAK
jgi:predicted nuclease of predicted toxin-antitoxin system